MFKCELGSNVQSEEPKPTEVICRAQEVSINSFKYVDIYETQPLMGFTTDTVSTSCQKPFKLFNILFTSAGLTDQEAFVC